MLFLRPLRLKESTKRCQSGAQMIEAALILPVLLLILFFFIDMVRYFYVSVGLNYAAYVAADLASKLEVELKADEDSYSSNPKDAERYKQIFDGIINEEQRIALNFASPSTSSNRSVRLIKFKHHNPSYYPSDNTRKPASIISDLVRDAAFLRPGDAVDELSPQGNFVRKYTHPIRQDALYSPPPPSTLAPGAKIGWPNPKVGERWENILREAPVAAHLEADFDLFTPFMGFVNPIRISATQFAFRRSPLSGITVPGTGATYTPTPTFTPSPTATFTSTFTFTPIPSNTPTRTNTPTFTPTLGAITIVPTINITVSPLPTFNRTSRPPRTPRPPRTRTPRPTRTGRPTRTSIPTSTIGNEPSATPVNTVPPTVVASFTPVVTPTRTPTLGTPTRTPTPTATFTPSRTPTFTFTPIPTPDCVSGNNPCIINDCFCFLNPDYGSCAYCYDQWACEQNPIDKCYNIEN